MKAEVKRQKIATDNGVKANNDLSVLYTLFPNFLAITKKPAIKKDDRTEKLSQMPVQMKEDESDCEAILY